ncbi:RNA methyltransferase [Maribacter algicola]|uniref:RNA methyltransferase n=1 Tax=Meishania litoralis TaxID=3434685 RepID=A0ACC7LK48_9FLAO
MRKLKNEELDRLSIDQFKNVEKIPLTIVLDNVRSLNNIGSVFRTADAFLIEKIYLCGITATPPNKDIRKTALGATESVVWAYAEDTLQLVQRLKLEGKTTLAIEQAEGATMLNDFKIEKGRSYVLIFGNEVKGVQQEVVDLCDGVIEIPQFGTKHSLNISVSVGVTLWNFWSKTKK